MSIGIVIAGGGTAGHVYPGLALADAIRRLEPGARIVFVGTSRGIERAAVPAAGYPLHLVEVVPWARTLGAKRFLAPPSLLGAVARARALLARLRPGVVVGMGGYASLPVTAAARTRGLRVILHEQNAIPGIANLVASRFVRRIALGFEEGRSRFPRSAEIRVTGNPVRASIARLERAAVRETARAALGLEAGRATVAFFGGSLGAARLNEAAIGLASRWRERADVQLLIAAGRAHGAEVGARAAEIGTRALVVRSVGFIERMELAYAAADLAVCRAGAASVAEIAAVGLPAILVPYPYARSNHQEANARALEHAGGARVILDRDASAETLGRTIEALLEGEGVLEAMAAGARSFGRPRAAEELAAWVLSLGEGSASPGSVRRG